MKKYAVLLLTVLLLFVCLSATADTAVPELSGLTHNCPNTGISIPAKFNPKTHSYILTVASWVSTVYFTPTTDDARATITANGKPVKNGGNTQSFTMTDEPQQVLIRVTDAQGNVGTYKIFLQRRPSDRRTRVSYGSIDSVYQKSGKWYISADLVTVTWDKNGLSSADDKSVYLYKYACDAHCAFYSGDAQYPQQYERAEDFAQAFQTGRLYRIVYIEDTIVAVMPFDTDY